MMMCHKVNGHRQTEQESGETSNTIECGLSKQAQHNNVETRRLFCSLRAANTALPFVVSCHGQSHSRHISLTPPSLSSTRT